MRNARPAEALVAVALLAAITLAACTVKQTADKLDQELIVVYPDKEKKE